MIASAEGSCSGVLAIRVVWKGILAATSWTIMSGVMVMREVVAKQMHSPISYSVYLGYAKHV